MDDGACGSRRIQEMAVPIIIGVPTFAHPTRVLSFHLGRLFRSKVDDEVVSDPSFSFGVDPVFPTTDIDDLVPCLGTKVLASHLTMMTNE